VTPDLTGRTFGRLAIVGPAGPENDPLPPVSGGWWTATCACGRQLTAPAEAFTSRRLTSCGRPTAAELAADAEWIATRQPPSRI
jgi:hypothetical protein